MKNGIAKCDHCGATEVYPLSHDLPARWGAIQAAGKHFCPECSATYDAMKHRHFAEVRDFLMGVDSGSDGAASVRADEPGSSNPDTGTP